MRSRVAWSVRAKKAKCTPNAGVVVRLRAGLGEQVLEPLLALGGDLVDHPAAPAGQRRDLARRRPGVSAASVIQPAACSRRSVG